MKMTNIAVGQHAKDHHEKRRKEPVQNANVNQLNGVARQTARWIGAVLRPCGARENRNGDERPEAQGGFDAANGHASTAEVPSRALLRAEHVSIDTGQGRQRARADQEDEHQVRLDLAEGQRGESPIVVESVLENVRQRAEMQVKEVADRRHEQVERTRATIERTLDEGQNVHRRSKETSAVEENAHVSRELLREIVILAGVHHPWVTRSVK